MWFDSIPVLEVCHLSIKMVSSMRVSERLAGQVMGWCLLPPFDPSRILLGEGDGTPLQYSCLENTMDGGAW